MTLTTATQAHSGDIAYLVVPGTNESYRAGGDADEERERRAATGRGYLLWPGGIVIYTLANSFNGISIGLNLPLSLPYLHVEGLIWKL